LHLSNGGDFRSSFVNVFLLLHLYISHTPADAKYALELREWLRPMEEKYHLRIWYNHKEPTPVLAFPWNLLFFWVNPSQYRRLPYHRDLTKEAEKAHIYLFLISQKSITTAWIEQEEVPRAVDRYQRLGNQYIRIFPVMLSASQWKMQSRLAGFPTLGPPGRALNQVNPREDALNAIAEQLRPVIEELRRNHIEENKRLGLPINTFNQPAPPWDDTPLEIVPFPNWLGWIVLIAILASVANWYSSYCKPRYAPYYPSLDPEPVEYDRSRDPMNTTPAVKPPTEIPVEDVDSTKELGKIRPPK
jgi:hypothetical protein